MHKLPRKAKTQTGVHALLSVLAVMMRPLPSGALYGECWHEVLGLRLGLLIKPAEAATADELLKDQALTSHTALPCCLSAGGLTLCGGTRCALVTFSLPLPQSFEPQNTQRTKYPVEPTSRYSHAGQITASDDVSCVCVQRCLMTNSAQDPGIPKRGSPGVVQRLLSSQSLRGIQGQQPLQQQHPLL